jgi:preprotein translocase subunit SecG
MQVLGFIVSLLLDVRAHIPNQPSFGSGPVDSSYGKPFVRTAAAFLIKTAFLATLIWVVVRFVMGFL